ncbi:MAG TPA: MliC family protein [Dyella sp.]|uniref:MliC family protein n=1 Tax=Dyella sp. TaxID=1869338 RepID=UPI002BFCEBA6|nr:MliC family protein [Dyella sp.]HTV87069.1 MliC family protein [Dyella sp.]
MTLALACCGAASAEQRAATDDAASWTNYVCRDGQTVQAAYPDTHTAWVKIKGQMHTLHVVISGSGARYTGEGWQWWTKGMREGMLAPLAKGETIADPGLACHAH